MKKIARKLSFVVLGLLIFASCDVKDKEATRPQANLKVAMNGWEYFIGDNDFESCSEVKEFPFFSSANVSIFNDENFLYVKVVAEEDWVIEKLYLTIWEGEIPRIFTHEDFPYQIVFPEAEYQSEVTFKIPRGDNWDVCMPLSLKIFTQNVIDGSRDHWYLTNDNLDSFDFFIQFCWEECEDCIEVIDIIAAQHYDVGDLIVWKENGDLYVKYAIDEGYKLEDAHLYVGCLGDIPVNKSGNPQIGHFPYNMSEDMVDGGIFVIPSDYLLNLECDCWVVAAHAVVSKMVGEEYWEETAWSDGNEFVDDRNWGTYSVSDCWCNE
ncbi:hypothetical protein [Plebeiibacterium marinum]|uniref:Uncharacterized protein n=1 Tax=Plebeiibacterium marinum TaxID=2992111 RepID=A0AAE3MAP7_9BACT|nr:hypothetical protein [Plebeiobacterium marinum]MCW3804169.1 hypothetical protein [Plebeiobacterium marinum]